MLDQTIDRLGDWNPQLFRELKSRGNGTQLTATFAISLLFQLILIGILASSSANFQDRATSCFYILNWSMPTVLVLGGAYAILADLNQEEKEGTLNFIRLSPQSARQIFLGKIIGVPSLIYLGISLMMPLHIISGIFAGANLLAILSWYATIGTLCYFCNSLTIIAALNHVKYAILWTLALFIPLTASLVFYSFNLATNRSLPSSNALTWYWLPIFTNFFVLSLFIISILLVVSYWLWVTIDRKYINPVSTVFKKSDSYWMNIQFQLWLLGFALPAAIGTNESSHDDNFYILTVFYSISTTWVFLTIPLILTARQSVSEWSRARRNLVTSEHHAAWRSTIIGDLIWHDRSPILGAMAINIAISNVVWGLYFCIFITDRHLIFKCLCGMLIAGILMLIQTVIISFISLRSRIKMQGVIPLIILMSWLPLLSGILVTINQNGKGIGLGLFLFSPFSWMAATQLPILKIGLIVLTQLGILAGSTKLLARKIIKLGNGRDRSIARQQPSLIKQA
jgi:hypothetical protein